MPTKSAKSTPKGKGVVAKSRTPESLKKSALAKGNTPKSLPPVKRKKLAEEIDDQLSDDDFEALLGGVREVENLKRNKGKETPSKNKKAEKGGGDNNEKSKSTPKKTPSKATPKKTPSKPTPKKTPSKPTPDKTPSKPTPDKAASKPTTKKSPKPQKAAAVPTGPVHKDTLFVKNLPKVSSKELRLELKNLCSTATWIYLPERKRKSGLESKGFALVKFPDEVQSKEALRKLQGLELRGSELNVCYSQQTSTTRAIPEPSEEERDPCRLYVSGKGGCVTEESIKKLFPTAISADIPKRKRSAVGYAFLKYATLEECRKAYTSAKEIPPSEQVMIIQYAKKRVEVGTKRKMPTEAKGKTAKAKKSKTDASVKTKEESDDDEDDEDDDDWSDEDDDDLDDLDGDDDDDDDEDDDDEEDDEDDDDDDDDNDDMDDDDDDDDDDE